MHVPKKVRNFSNSEIDSLSQNLNSQDSVAKFNYLGWSFGVVNVEVSPCLDRW